jgi:hypothetical protein
MPSLSLKASINCPIIGGSSGSPYDPDAFAWFNAVEATGANFGASPESIASNKTAFNTAFLSLKSDGIWSAIRQACFLVGPSTIAGALVNIKLTGNPVNYNFTSANYNKLTGLIGSLDVYPNETRYLDTLLNDTTDINGLDFHLIAQTSTPYFSIGDRREYIIGSNNDGGTIGVNMGIYQQNDSFRLFPNAYEGLFFGIGFDTVGFSRYLENVNYYSTDGWGNYYTEYGEYYSGNNFTVFKTQPQFASENFGFYRGNISFYSIGSSITNKVELFQNIVDSLKSSLVN